MKLISVACMDKHCLLEVEPPEGSDAAFNCALHDMMDVAMEHAFNNHGHVVRVSIEGVVHSTHVATRKDGVVERDELVH